ncbi:MAG: exopolyphosphatase, partial [Clostridia bacterium]|nr:exopolyphosphatase [Clostridia bacterium]
MSLKCAVIDLGSNSARLGIYEAENGQIVPISAFRYTSRLSEGLSKDNLLTKPAIERTLFAFKQFKAEIDKFEEIKVRCVATEALRRAENSETFIELVRKETGISIEILSGEKEAKYGLFGAKMSAKCDNFYMLDTGGGSFEVALCENGKLKYNTSL